MSEDVLITKVSERAKAAWVEYGVYHRVAYTLMDKVCEAVVAKAKEKGWHKLPWYKDTQLEKVSDALAASVVEGFAQAERKRAAFWDLVKAEADLSDYEIYTYDHDKGEVRGVPKAKGA